MVAQTAAKNIRVRFPPSPTGIPHIGNTRTALFNYLFAKHHKGTFILRIEDTDRARLVPEAEEAIKEILNWLDMKPDEFYKQSERLALYQKATEELLERGLARKDEGAVRFIIPKGQTVSWTDAIGNKDISFNTNDIEDFVILKSDGFPTYHLANVIDDHAMKISHVIRGDEWISSVPKHILLYKAFGWEHPVFAHLPVILGPDKGKLSKRHGAKSVLEYRDEGFLKEALLNFMALLGWNPGEDREIMDFKTMINLFDLSDVNTASPMFDIKKLEWMNGVYIRQMKSEKLKSKIKMQKAKVSDEVATKIVSLAQTRMKTLNDFESLVTPFFEEMTSTLNDKEKTVAKKLREELVAIKQWNKEEILPAMKRVLTQEDARMPIIYKIFTGRENGLPMADMLEILGKENVLKRLEKV